MFSPFHFLVSPFYGRDAIAPSPPTPLPLRGRGEDFVFLGCCGTRVASLARGVRAGFDVESIADFSARIR
ncbi:hypothetical protein LBMAG46_38340 [Planctomycetia bacterium]|nr:hypothetical protein LBMAG46_38340 [Planctomycetia bacterium]